MLQGLNWFGFETSATMVAGLWAGSSSLTQDFKTIVWRMRLLGFNAVRLPFSFKVGGEERLKITTCLGQGVLGARSWHHKLPVSRCAGKKGLSTTVCVSQGGAGNRVLRSLSDSSSLSMKLATLHEIATAPVYGT